MAAALSRGRRGSRSRSAYGPSDNPDGSHGDDVGPRTRSWRPPPADAAADNWTFLETLSPETEVIDFWHACEHLRTASDHAVASDWFERYREVLRHDPCGVDKVIRALRHLRDSGKPDRAEIERELAFFRKHRQRMRYHALKAEGVAIGSGVVEAANKTLVTQRMKRSGMRWRIAGGQAVLTFRALIKSARFDRAWKAIIGATDTPANDKINPLCRHRHRCLNSMNEAPAINAIRDSHPVGTAIATLVRKANPESSTEMEFRHLWGQEKPAELLDTAAAEPGTIYEVGKPDFRLGLPFKPVAVSSAWFEWPTLLDLFPTWFPGVQTGRDGFLVDDDFDRLNTRVCEYFDNSVTHDEIARRYPRVMANTARFDARAVRETLLARGGPDETGFVRYSYRPFDNRWLYWEEETKLLREKSPRYPHHIFEGNTWLVLQNKARPDLSPPLIISNIGDLKSDE